MLEKSYIYVLNSHVVYMLSLYKLLKVYSVYNISGGFFRVIVFRLGPT